MLEPYVKSKYRSNAIQPEETIVKPNQTMSIAKKVKIIEKIENIQIETVKYQAPLMDPSLTQVRKIQSVVKSNESEFRAYENPNIFERVKFYKKYLQNEAHRQKIANNKELSRKRLLNNLDSLMNSIENNTSNETNNNNNTNTSIPSNTHENNDDNDFIDESNLSMEDLDEEDPENDEIIARIKKFLTKKLEISLLKSRNTHLFHSYINIFYRFFISCMIPMHLNINISNITIKSILPWLIIHSNERMNDYNYLLELSVSHILNLTLNYRNYFPEKFIYQNYKIKDLENFVEIAKYWKRICAFIKHVEVMKGKVS